MQQFRLIDVSSPLHRLHRHHPGFYIEHRNFTSFHQFWVYTAMTIDGEHQLAENMHLDLDGRRNPGTIDGFCRAHNYSPSCKVLFASVRIYNALWAYLIAHNDPVVDDLLCEIGNTPYPDIKFVECKQNDYVWSSALRAYPTWRMRHQIPGSNLYGEVLDDAARMVKTANTNVQPSVTQLWNHDALASRCPESVLVVSDSMISRMSRIGCGVNPNVVPVGGGTLGKIMREVDHKGIRFRDFEYVIICGGINDAQKSEEKRAESLSEFLDHLDKQIRRGADSQRILCSLPAPHPHVTGVVELSTAVEQALGFRNVHVLNWADQAGGPFVDNGWVNDPKLTETDQFHMSHAGIRELYKRWCLYFPELRMIPYSLTYEGYQQM